jgi:hypothetical membrane protein
VVRTPERTISVAVTSRRLGLLGLASVGVILGGMVISAIPYRGYENEAYSPLNHFVSELGEIAASRLAWAFNLGIVLGGVGLGTFLLLLTDRLTGRFRTALVAAGVVAGVSGTLVGVFPMDYVGTHRLVSVVFFLIGWIVAGLFSAWLLATRRAGFPRWLFIPGAATVAISWAFIAVYSTYIGTDAAGRILNRPDPFWSIAYLEWASLLSLLVWFGLVSLVLLREPAD